MATGLTPSSSSASITAIWASPRAPPPPSASARVLRLAPCVVGGVLSACSGGFPPPLWGRAREGGVCFTVERSPPPDRPAAGRPPPQGGRCQARLRLGLQLPCARLPGGRPRRLRQRPHQLRARRRVLAGGRAVAHPPDDALQDRGDPDEIIGHVLLQIRSRVEPGALDVAIDIGVARGNAERGEIEH